MLALRFACEETSGSEEPLGRGIFWIVSALAVRRPRCPPCINCVSGFRLIHCAPVASLSSLLVFTTSLVIGYDIAVAMGAGEKQDVNAIWAQLNASKGTGSARASRVWENIKSGNDPAKPATAKRPDASAAVSKAFPSPSPAATRVEGAVVSRAQGIDVSGIATEEELGKLLQRDLYGLKDTVTSTRKVALERLLGCVQVSARGSDTSPRRPALPPPLESRLTN